jgi:hypothetical protein
VFGGTSPRSHGRVRSAAASTQAGDARPARARCGTAMRAGVAVRSYGTAAGRPLGRRVNDRERTSRPDGKARLDPARAASSAGTGRAAGGAVPVSGRLAAPRTRLFQRQEAPPACHRTRACSRRRLRGPQPGPFLSGKRAAASSRRGVFAAGKLSSAHVPVSRHRGGGSHVAWSRSCRNSPRSRRTDAAQLTPKRWAATLFPRVI